MTALDQAYNQGRGDVLRYLINYVGGECAVPVEILAGELGIEDHCQHVLFAATNDPPQPAEYCDRDQLPDSDFCEMHQEDQ